MRTSFDFTNRPRLESKFLPRNYNLNGLRTSGWYAPLGELLNIPDDFNLYHLFVIAPNPDLYVTQMAFGVSYRLIQPATTEGDEPIVPDEIIRDRNDNIVYTNRRLAADTSGDGIPDTDNNNFVIQVGDEGFNVIRVITNDEIPYDVTVNEAVTDNLRNLYKQARDSVVKGSEEQKANYDKFEVHILSDSGMMFIDSDGNKYDLDLGSNEVTNIRNAIQQSVAANTIDNEKVDENDNTVVKSLQTLDDEYDTFLQSEDKSNYLETTLDNVIANTPKGDEPVVKAKGIVNDEPELVILNRSAIYTRSYMNGSWTAWTTFTASNTSSSSSSSSGSGEPVNYEKIYSYVNDRLGFLSHVQGVDIHGLQAEITSIYDTAAYAPDANIYSVVASGIKYDTPDEFPEVGDPTKLYVSTQLNQLYRYDENTHTYYCVGSDYNDIFKIVSGFADGPDNQTGLSDPELDDNTNNNPDNDINNDPDNDINGDINIDNP